MNKTIRLIVTLLLVISVVCLEVIGFSQPNLPKDDIPSDISADVRIVGTFF